MPQPIQPQLLYERDVAQRLLISTSTLRRWRMQGTGPNYIRVGGVRGSSIRYREADIEAWLGKNFVEAKIGGVNVRPNR